MTALRGAAHVPPQATGAVVFLHGYGSNGDDLMGLAPLMAPPLPHIAFFGPNAPRPTVFGMGYQWFSDAGGTFDDRTGIAEATTLLEDYLTTTVWGTHGISPQKTVLVGFSQGTMTALFAAPRLKQKIAGVVGFSGRLMYAQELADGSGHRLPVLLAHGTDDDVVPATDSQRAQEALTALGFAVQTAFYPDLPHSIDMRGISDALRFIQEVIPA
jgi:phospholipase/carboxylesterase